MWYLLISLITILIYAWLIYPLLILYLGKKPFLKASDNAVKSNALYIIIAAYNEEDVIRKRIENLQECVKVYQEKYINSVIYIKLGIDLSTDDTLKIANCMSKEYRNLEVISFNKRMGKTGIIKNIVANIDDKESILVFTDANTIFKRDALTVLVSGFGAQVGGVCGQLTIKNNAQFIDTGESKLWSIENKLKLAESNIKSCLGVNGAIYAIRRFLFFDEIPDNAIIDDFIIGMKVIEQGWYLLYIPNAIAYEDAADEKSEWCRRVRIGMGDMQAIPLCIRLLLPNKGIIAWMFFSHKILRWFTPHIFFLILIIASLLIYKVSFLYLIYSYIAILFIIIIFYSLRRKKTIGLINHFFIIQIALFIGTIKYFIQNTEGYWERTSR